MLRRRSRQVASGTFLVQALFLAVGVLRLLFDKALSPRRLLVVVLSSLGFLLDVWVARTLSLTTRLRTLSAQTLLLQPPFLGCQTPSAA